MVVGRGRGTCVIIIYLHGPQRGGGGKEGNAFTNSITLNSARGGGWGWGWKELERITLYTEKGRGLVPTNYFYYALTIFFTLNSQWEGVEEGRERGKGKMRGKGRWTNPPNSTTPSHSPLVVTKRHREGEGQGGGRRGSRRVKGRGIIHGLMIYLPISSLWHFTQRGRGRPRLRGRGRSQLIFEEGKDCFPPSPLPAPLSLIVLYDEGIDKCIIKMVVTFPSPFLSARSLSLCTISRWKMVNISFKHG